MPQTRRRSAKRRGSPPSLEPRLTTTVRGVLAEANLGHLWALARIHARLLARDDNTNAFLGKPYSAPILACALDVSTFDQLTVELAKL